MTSLQRNFAAHIEKTNADLAKKLAELRLAILGSGKTKPSYNEKKWFETFQKRFRGSYLKNPVLWGDDGKPYTGWDQIVPYLAGIIPTTTYIGPQGVNVYLEYLPLMSQKYADQNKNKIKEIEDLPNEIDFLASIRTVLAYAPYDDPLEIGNAAPIPHRKVCDPIY